MHDLCETGPRNVNRIKISPFVLRTCFPQSVSCPRCTTFSRSFRFRKLFSQLIEALNPGFFIVLRAYSRRALLVTGCLSSLCFKTQSLISRSALLVHLSATFFNEKPKTVVNYKPHRTIVLKKGIG